MLLKLDKHFTFNVSDPATARLISFVSEVCEDLQLEMIGEGIETEEDKKMMLDLGCQIGQGYLMHRPDFLDSFKPEGNINMDKLTPKETSKGAEEIVLTQIKQDFITPANAIFDYVDMVEKVLNDAELNQRMRLSKLNHLALN